MSESQLRTSETLRSSETLQTDVGPVSVGTVVQRNWSRCATGQLGDRTVFVKQFIDRTGRTHRQGFLGDRTTQQDLSQDGALPPNFAIPERVAEVDGRNIVVLEHVEMATLDGAFKNRVRSDTARHIGQACRELIQHRSAQQSDRNEPTRLWKGFDPKNLGQRSDGTTVVFDFGPPTQTPRADAFSRACAFGLAAAWRSSNPRSWILANGAPTVSEVVRPLASGSDRELVENELRQLFDLRRNEPLRRGILSAGTRAAVGTFSPRYINRALNILDNVLQEE